MARLAAQTAPAAAPLDTYDYIAGTQVFSSSYHFTDKPLLVEGAEQINGMGSNMIKFILGPGYVKNRGGKKDPNINSLTDLAQDAEYKKVFDMPFSRYFMWVYSFSTNGKIFPLHGPIRPEVLDQEYKEVYALTKYMLTTYNGTGKTFYFGSWEGDWQLIAGAKPEIKDMELRRVIDPLPDSPQAMASWASTRQRAIDDAKRDTPHKNVQVWYYLETNMLQKSIKEGRVSVASAVVPLANPDFVSYSAYDSTDPDRDLHNDLPHALDYMQSKLKPKPGLPARRVFVGEFGAPTLHYTPQQQDARVRDVMATAIQWGTPFVLYWQLYNNELEPNGTPRGFWLIDDKGVKQPVYFTLQKYYADARAYVADFTKKNKRQPDDQEFERFAYQWFRTPVKPQLRAAFREQPSCPLSSGQRCRE
jgi:hypothetical protein